MTKEEFNNLKSQFVISSTVWGGRRKNHLPYEKEYRRQKKNKDCCDALAMMYID